MGLFSIFKKKEKTNCCDMKIESVAPDAKATSTERKEGEVELIVLGTGCAKCKTVMEIVQKAVDSKGIDASISKEEDIEKIMGYGVMSTPAVVLNGKVVVKGRVPKESEIEELLEGTKTELKDGSCSCGGKC